MKQNESPESGTRIGTDMVIRGKIECTDSVTVEGLFEGEFHGSDLHIHNHGSVSGQIIANFIDCSGRLAGEIVSSELVLRKKGCHKGTVTTDRLTVEPGAVLDCALQSGVEPARMESSQVPEQTVEQSVDLSRWLTVFSTTRTVCCMDVPGSERTMLFRNILELLEKDKALIKIEGGPGSGKTLFAEKLMRDLPDKFQLVALAGQIGSVTDSLTSIAAGLGCPTDSVDQKALLEIVQTRLSELHRQGKKAVLIVDDAQEMYPATMEGMIRLLSEALEPRDGSLQIVLLGTSGMVKNMVETILEYFEDETNCQLELMPLNIKDCADYLRLCLRNAGDGNGEAALSVFPYETIKALHSISRGNPTEVNGLATDGLRRATETGASKVSPDHLK